MGTSRDFTTGPDADLAGGTVLLERDAEAQVGNRQDSTTQHVGARRGYRTGYAPHTPRDYRGEGIRPRTLRELEYPPRRGGGRGTGGLKRLGSRQVVSHRGRRLTPVKKYQRFSRVSVVVISLLIAGVALAVWLSGLSTAQTFKVQNLTVQESQLTNQLESLNRDLEDVRSTADIANRAVENRMGVPTEPGIIAAKNDGGIDTRREPQPGMESIIDVNGEPVRPGKASSDPDATRNVSDNLEATPRGAQEDDLDRSRNQGRDRAGSDREQDVRGAESSEGNASEREAEAPRVVEEKPDAPMPAPYEAVVR